MGWIFLLYTLCIALSLTEAAVLEYDVEVVNRRNIVSLPSDHWAKYNTDAFFQGQESKVSNYDDAPFFEDINITTPFFSRDVVRWHVSSDGFLAPTLSPMCSFFCTEVSLDSLFGNYKFGKSVDGGGGDWPMIGLYVADLNPSQGGSQSGIRVLGVAKSGGADDGSEYERVIVEYANVPVVRCPLATGLLTAQVELWDNGTIVMRYRDVPTCGTASVGLVLSKAERVMATTLPQPQNIVAIRFEPRMDRCPALTDEVSCVSDGGECGWCTVTRSCVAVLLAKFSCPSVSFRSQSPAPPLPNDYYDVVVEQGADLIYLSDLGDSVDVPSPGDSIELDIGFGFPFFTRDQQSHMANKVYLLSSGAVSVFSPTQACRPIWNMCPNGNYTFTIMPFVTTERWGFGTSVSYAHLPERIQGDALCEDTRCPPGIIVELNGMNHVDTYVRGSTYQIYMDGSGTVEFRYGSPLKDGFTMRPVMDFFAFPPPFIGLFRHRVEDPATVTVPLSLIRTGTRVRFTPTRLCNDCGLNGTCDATTLNCVCGTGFSGEFCEDCAAGYYGPSCLPCRQCGNGGSCDDGVNGTGSCVCPEPYSGIDCAVQCMQPFNCSRCSQRGGYCECGVCRCDAASGWGGPYCDTPYDPCQRYSFDGCEVCNRNKTNWCGFCFDNTCYSTLLTGKPNGYACSYSIVDVDAALCVPAVQRPAFAMDFGYIALAVLSISAVFALIVLMVFARLAVRTQGLYDIHVAGASGGAPDHKPGRRPREVVQSVFVPQEALGDKGKHVLGIPLKQISLKKLYESQRDGQPRQRKH